MLQQQFLFSLFSYFYFRYFSIFNIFRFSSFFKFLATSFNQIWESFNKLNGVHRQNFEKTRSIDWQPWYWFILRCFSVVMIVFMIIKKWLGNKKLLFIPLYFVTAPKCSLKSVPLCNITCISLVVKLKFSQSSSSL